MLYKEVNKIFDNDEYWKDDKKDFAKILMDSCYEGINKRVNEYEIWQLNIGLFMFCTVFELYLQHIFDLLIRDENRIKHLLDRNEKSKKDSIKIKSNNFGYRGIEDKIAWLKKIGVDFEKVCLFKHLPKEGKDFMSEFNADTLVEIYEKRHGIAHRRVVGISDVSELLKIKNIFEGFIMEVSSVIEKDLKVDLDLLDLMDIKEKNVGVGRRAQSTPPSSSAA